MGESGAIRKDEETRIEVRSPASPGGASAGLGIPQTGDLQADKLFESTSEAGEGHSLGRLLSLVSTPPLSRLVQSRHPSEWLVIGGVAAATSVLAYCSVLASDPLSIVTTCFVALLSGFFGLYEAQRVLRIERTVYGAVCALPALGVAVSAVATVVSLATTPDGSVPVHTVATSPLLVCGYAILVGSLTHRCKRVKPVDTGSLFGLEGGIRRVVGEQVTLKAGDLVVADTRIDRGSCSVAERRFSPLANMRVKDETEILYAGSQVIGGEVQGVVVASSEVAALRRVDALLSPLINASEKALTLRIRERALFHLFAVLGAALSIGGFWFWRVGTPTNPILAAGLLMFLGIFPWGAQLLSCLEERLVRGWAREGLLVTSPDGVVGVTGIEQVVFEPYVVEPGFTRDVTRLEVLDDRIELRALAGFLGSLLGRAEDPAFLAAAQFCVKQVGSFVPERVVDLREYPGLGICGTVRGVEVSVGSEDFLVQRGIQMPVEERYADDGGRDVICVAIDDDLVGRFWVSYGQATLVHSDGAGHWPRGVRSFIVGELAAPETSTTLSVGRSAESCEGAGATPALIFSLDGAIPARPSMLLSLTRDLRELPSLFSGARALVGAVTRAAIALQVLGAVLVLAVFGGILSGWVPLALAAVYAVGVWRWRAGLLAGNE